MSTMFAHSGLPHENPARLDGDGEQLDRCVGDQVGEVVFVLGSSAMFADQPGFVPGICWPRMSRMLCDGPSATRTRTAGKRVDSRRLVPRRQLTERQDAPPRIASTPIDLRETANPGNHAGALHTLQRVGCLDHGRSGALLPAVQDAAHEASLAAVACRSSRSAIVMLPVTFAGKLGDPRHGHHLRRESRIRIRIAERHGAATLVQFGSKHTVDLL